jgi:chromosome segregation ATPase
MTRKVEDLMQRMRGRARDHLAADESMAGANDAQEVLARLRADIGAARRAHDQLPPLTTYRKGLSARLELWIKRRFKRATHWFTWEQLNFNAATLRSLENLLPLVARIEGTTAELNIDAASTNTEQSLARLQADVAALKQTCEALVNGVQELQREQGRLADEQRVCLRQLSNQVAEFAAVGDRAKRNLQTQLDETNRRLDEISRAQEPSRNS